MNEDYFCGRDFITKNNLNYKYNDNIMISIVKYVRIR